MIGHLTTCITVSMWRLGFGLLEISEVSVHIGYEREMF